MTIEERLKAAARDTNDWTEYAQVVGLGANAIIPAIREMESRDFTARQVATVLRHIADKVSPPKRKTAKK